MTMIEYFLENMWQLWAIVAVICLILELSSGDFFIICFSIGAVFAAIGAALSLNFYWQLALFALFTVVALFTVRPIALRYLHKNEPNKPSNADALLGRTGRVTEPIPADDTGYVQIDSDQWRAVSSTKTPIDQGVSVRVVGRESTIITVETL
jgi:membrane protein implicated in regulation of membrane protease activity